MTTIAKIALAGERRIEIEPLTCGLYKGDTLVVAGGTDSEELVVILDFGSIILKEGLLFDHPAGTTMEYVENVAPPPSTPSEEEETSDTSPLLAALFSVGGTDVPLVAVIGAAIGLVSSCAAASPSSAAAAAARAKRPRRADARRGEHEEREHGGGGGDDQRDAKRRGSVVKNRRRRRGCRRRRRCCPKGEQGVSSKRRTTACSTTTTRAAERPRWDRPTGGLTDESEIERNGKVVGRISEGVSAGLVPER